VPEPAKRSKWYRWRRDGTSLVNYLLDSEVHTFAFSVAANAILSFIPFIVLLLHAEGYGLPPLGDDERSHLRHGRLLRAF